MYDQDAAGKFLKLSLSWRNPKGNEMENPARQQFLLLTREALSTFMGLGMGNTAIESVLQRCSRDVPSLSS